MLKRLDQDHLHPKLEVPGLTCLCRESHPGLHGWEASILEKIYANSLVILAIQNIYIRARENVLFFWVLWIHDILVWNRIRIRGSMPLTNGYGSFYFHHWPSRWQQKKQMLLKKIYCILLSEGTFTSFFKGKKSKRSNKTVEIKVFLTIFA